MGTIAKSEISQDAENADQNVKWFLKVHTNIRTFVGNTFFN